MAAFAAPAATVITTLVDTDANTSTGCTVRDVAGMEHAVATTVENGQVVSISRRSCTGGAMTPAGESVAGWPVPLVDGASAVETSISWEFLGIPRTGRAHFVFLVDDTAGSLAIVQTPRGEPIVYGATSPGRRRSARPAAGGPLPALDGNLLDWAQIPVLLSSGNVTVRLRAGGDQLFLRFDVRPLDPQAPEAEGESYVVGQGKTLEIAAPGVLANDSDPNGLPLSAVKLTAPEFGSLELLTDGGFVYVHDGSAAVADAFQYTATNGTHTSDVATVTIAVAPGTVPVAVNDAYSVSNGGTLSIAAPGVLANDLDPESDALTATLVAAPQHGAVTLNADGSFQYVHDGSGLADQFTYRAADGESQSTEAVVLIAIAGTNAAPVASNENYDAVEDQPLTVAVAEGVRANDYDLDGDPLTVDLVTPPSHGVLALSAVGSFTYTPSRNFNGSDSFEYRVSDGTLLSNVARAAIDVASVDDAPVAAADLATVAEGAALAIAVLANDVDVDNALVPAIATAPAHGTAVVNAAGTITYTHDGSETTSDSFTYVVTGGAVTSGAVAVSVTITHVNDAPVAGNDSAAVNEGASTNIAVLVNDSDADSVSLTPVVDAAPAHGAAIVNGDGTITYTHDGSETTSDIFTYRVSDGSASSSVVTVGITVVAVNDAPAAGNDSTTVDEGASTNIAVLTNDSDAEGSSLTPVIEIAPVRGTATVNADGTITYAHDGGETTSDSFTYVVNDGSANSVAATVTITINALNDAPVAGNDSATLNEGASTHIAVLANDSDADDSSLTPVIDAAPANGAATVNADGTVTYVHNGSETTSDSFTYHVTDGTASSSVVTVSITITATNDTPIAGNDSATLNEGASTNIGVLTNDSDAEGSALTPAIGIAPAHGTANVNADGTITYTHDGSETTTDSFTYHATDGTASSTVVTVSISITAANDTPLAGNDSATLNEGASTNIAVLTNDTDAEGTTLTPAISTTPGRGTATVNADGTITYTHDGSETTVDSFAYVANDGTANSVAATVTITINAVNDAPVAANDSATVNEGASTSIAVLANDSDADNATLTPVIDAAPAAGTATVNADGTVTYTHNGSETTTDSFTYHATDGTASSTVVAVSISITAANDTPIAGNDSVTLNEGASTSIAVLTNDSDAEGSALTPAISIAPAHGTAAVNSDGTITYTHDGSETTADSFAYVANDGTANSVAATVTITINAVNDAPVAANDSATVNEGTSTSIAVLANDSDADHATLTPVIDAAPANGTATVNADGTVTYTHDGSETTTDSFTYHATDGTASSTVVTVSISITAANDTPIAANDSATLNEGASTSIAVLTNDTDAEGTTLTPAISTTPAHGAATVNVDGTITYTHDGSETTSDSFTYVANDGTANSAAATVTITINALNDAPVAATDSATVNEGTSTSIAVLANDSDADHATLTPVIDAAPANGTATVNADGTITYTHNGGETPSDTFTYHVTDGTASSSVVTVSIAITAANDTPIAANDSATLNEGASTSIAVLTNDSDAEGSALTPAISTNPAHGAATVNADGTITYTHDGSETTSDSFTYVANDGTANSVAATVTITINPLNDAPVAANDSATVNESAFTDVDVLGNDTDEEGSSLTAQIVAGPAHGTAVANGDGTIRYTHGGGETTSDSFTYRAHDGTAAGNTVTVTITISGLNDTPVANDDSETVGEGASKNIAVLLNDSDAENATLTPAIVNVPSHGTATVNANGTIAYTHDGSETTSDGFTYEISDGTTSSGVATVTITIAPANDAPAANDDSATVSEGGSTIIAVLTNDSDAEGSALTPVASAPAYGTATVNGDGTITYTHDGGESTSDSFTYTVSDGSATSNAATVTITITGANDAPVAVSDSASVGEGAAVTINVTANDTDAEGATLTPTVATTPAHGTAVVNADRTITYTHDGGETLSDSFTYSVSDGSATSNTATVTITIAPMNDLPVAADESYVYPSGAGPLLVSAPGILGNDTDPEGSSLTTLLVTSPAEGSLTLDANGGFSYTKAASPSLSAVTFTYRASDGSANSAAAATVTISLATAPVADNDTYTTLEDVAVMSGTPGVLDGDSDAENDIAKIIVVSGPNCDGYAAGACGTLYSSAGDDGIKDNGSFQYLPPANFFGAVTITYKLEDATGLQSADATLTINVTAVNDEPTFAPGLNLAVDMNSDVYSAVWATGVSAGAANESDQILTFEATTLNTSLFQGFTDCSGGPGVACVVVPEGNVYINPDTGVIKFKPATNASGTTIVLVKLIDDGGAENGGVNATPDEWQLRITVRSVNINDPPSFSGQNVTVLEDSAAKSVANWATNVTQGSGDSGQTVSFVVSSVSDPTLFSVQPSISAARTLTFTPAPDAFGTATISVYAQDTGGTANGGDNTSDAQTYTINITSINDAPLFTRGADLSYAAGTTGAQSVNNWATNIGPGAANETQTLTFSTTVRSGSSIFDVAPALDATGNLSFSLNGTTGLATIDVTLADNGDTTNGGANTSAVQTFTINVGGVNSPPAFTKGANVTVDEDSSAHTAAGWATAISPGPAADLGQSVSFNVTTNNDALFSVPPAVDGSTGTLTFTPAADRHGTATVSVVAVDTGGIAGGGDHESDAQTFTITISSINDRPALTLASSGISIGVNRGAVSTSAFASTTAGPFETGQTPFTYAVAAVSSTNPSLFTVAPSIASNGTLTYTVADNQTGSATFAVTVQDAGGTANGGLDTSLPQSFTIDVTNGGAPTVPAAPIAITAYANIPLSITSADGTAYLLLDGASDPENQLPLSVVVTQKPANSLVTIDSALGAFTFRSGDLSYSGGAIDAQQFKYRVCDAAANCSAERAVNVSFFTPLVFFTDDDTSHATGLGTFDVPRRGLLSGFDASSAAPPATYVIMSGSYLTNSTGSATTLYLRGGDLVVGQGMPGLTFASLGISHPPVGSLPSLPTLSSGTKPTITIYDSFPDENTSDPNIGALFVGLSGGTVKNLTITKQTPDKGSWILLATNSGFCCVGTPGTTGNYEFDRITQTNGQGFVVSQPGAALTVSNSTITGTHAFAMNNGTLSLINTDVTLTGSALGSAYFIQSTSSSAAQNLTVTVDADSSITGSGRRASIFRPESTTNSGWSAHLPLGTYTFDCPITIAVTNIDYPALAIRGRAGHTIAFNGKLDLTAAGTQVLRVAAESTGAGTLTMSNAANRFKTTAATYTSSSYGGNAIQYSDMAVGAAGINLSNLSINAGNLSFTNTTGGANGPIVVASGTVNGNGSQACVARSNATNVTVNAAVAFTNCTP